jgi:predicted branched-subunit amino acid permease
LDLIILFFLAREIGRLAYKKGLKSLTWKIYTAVAWIFSEIIGIMAGFLFFDKDNLFSIGMIGLTFALTSYFIIKAQLNKLPDFDDDINRIGNN